MLKTFNCIISPSIQFSNIFNKFCNAIMNMNNSANESINFQESYTITPHHHAANVCEKGLYDFMVCSMHNVYNNAIARQVTHYMWLLSSKIKSCIFDTSKATVNSHNNNIEHLHKCEPNFSYFAFSAGIAIGTITLACLCLLNAIIKEHQLNKALKKPKIRTNNQNNIYIGYKKESTLIEEKKAEDPIKSALEESRDICETEPKNLEPKTLISLEDHQQVAGEVLAQGYIT